ncbi:hypothetical protein N9Y67_00690 [Pseudomonadota bacterium]|nr:hypothetical protein [Pseudomonadota bacterium]
MKQYNVSAGHAMSPKVVFIKVRQGILGWHDAGITASIYNTTLESGFNTLTSFMSIFERKYGLTYE